jgi:hypothetical protein
MANGSRTYEFRITCYLAGGNFETEEREIALELPGYPRPITVNLPDKRAAGDRLVIFRCGGFQSESEARAAGEPLKTAVMLIRTRTGTHKTAAAASPPVRKASKCGSRCK